MRLCQGWGIVRSVPPAIAELLTGPEVAITRVFGDTAVGVHHVEAGKTAGAGFNSATGRK